MKKTVKLFPLGILLTLLLVACTKSGKQTVKDPGDLVALQKLYETEMKDYRTWPFFPGTNEMMDGADGSAPHGRYVTVYSNKTATDAANSNLEQMPDGAIISKDAFDSDREYRNTILMKKIDGVWHFGAIRIDNRPKPEFIKFDKAGTEVTKSCTNCHTHVEKDMVYVWE